MSSSGSDTTSVCALSSTWERAASTARHDRREQQPPHAELDPALADAGDVEEVVDEPGELVDAALRDLEGALAPRGLDPRAHHGVPDDRERVAELVAEHGQELVLRSVRGDQLLEGRAACALALLEGLVAVAQHGLGAPPPRDLGLQHPGPALELGDRRLPGGRSPHRAVALGRADLGVLRADGRERRAVEVPGEALQGVSAQDLERQLAGDLVPRRFQREGRLAAPALPEQRHHLPVDAHAAAAAPGAPDLGAGDLAQASRIDAAAAHEALQSRPGVDGQVALLVPGASEVVAELVEAPLDAHQMELRGDQHHAFAGVHAVGGEAGDLVDEEAVLLEELDRVRKAGGMGEDFAHPPTSAEALPSASIG
jgi:hypothetical protein